MRDDETITHPPAYAQCLAVRITPYTSDGVPDHDQAATYRFECEKNPVVLGYAYRTYEPAIHQSPGSVPCGSAAPGLLGFTAPNDHPDTRYRAELRALTDFAIALLPRPAAPLAIDAWVKATGSSGETLYLLVPRWHRRASRSGGLPAPRGHHLFALGDAMPTTEANTWPRTNGGDYHVKSGTSLSLSTDTSTPPAAGFPAPARQLPTVWPAGNKQSLGVHTG